MFVYNLSQFVCLEIDCFSDATNRCHPSYFSCVRTTGCILARFVCDNERDCLDGSDEIDCGEKSNTPRFYFH